MADAKISALASLSGASLAVDDLFPVVDVSAGTAGSKNLRVDDLFAMAAVGDTIYGGTAGLRTALSGNTTATKKFLTQTGNGSVSAAPAWGGIVVGDLTDGMITNAKLTDVATATFKGRTTAGTGVPEDLTVSQAKVLLNLSGTNSGDQTADETTLHLSGAQFSILDPELLALAGLTSAANKVPYFTGSGTAALANFTPAGHDLTLSANATIGGTNTGDQTITLTGDVTGSGTGSFAASIPSGTVTFAQLNSGTYDTDATLAANSNSKLPTQQAVKAYVDNLITGLKWKTAVRAATTALGVLATDFENGDTLDGVTLATGDRILIKNQSTHSQNGIYVVAASGSPTRATDADVGSELVNAVMFVSEGTVNGDTQWVCTNNSIPTLGVNTVDFAQVSGAGTYTSDNTTLTLAGNTFSVATNGVSNTYLSDVPTATFKGRTTAGTGDPEDLTVSQAKVLLNLTGTNSGDQTITLTGDVTGSGTGSFAATIANDAVTYAKMQNVAAVSLVGNPTGGSTDPSGITLGSSLAFSGTTLTRAALTGDATASADNNAITVVGASTSFAYTGVLTPPQITANAHNYNPTGLSTASIVRVSGDVAGWAITGLVGGTSGRRITLVNVGTTLMYLYGENNNSTAGNRFNWGTAINGVGMNFPAKCSVTLIYDSTLVRWVVAACSWTNGANIYDDQATAGHIMISDGTRFGGYSVSGDATMDSGGVLTIGNNKVTYAYLQQGSGKSVLGRGANSTGNNADIIAATNGDTLWFNGTSVQFSQLDGNACIASGTIQNTQLANAAVLTSKINDNAVTTVKIANSNVTLAKIANASQNSCLVGSGSAGTGIAYTELTIGAGLTMNSSSIQSKDWDQYLVKGSNQDVTNSAALTDDSTLQFSVGTGEVWYFELLLVYSGSSATGDMKIAMTVSTGSFSGWHSYIGSDTSADAINVSTGVRDGAVSTWAAPVVLGTDASDTKRTMLVTGMFIGSTVQTFKLQFAQSTATSSTHARVCSGSILRAKKLV